MEQVLDNPAFYAMISGNKALSLGTASVRYFPVEVSPFVGLYRFDSASFSELADMLEPKVVAVTVSAEPISIPLPWKVIHHGIGLQMLGENAMEPEDIPWKVVPLERPHVRQMLELARLTNPGPFTERTIEFGNFTGIFHQERLIAMSGHRLHPSSYIEISGVCTHPDYTDRGLGAALTLLQVRRIRAESSIPFLHVWAHNEKAIRLYKKLGFTTRKEMHFNILEK